MSGLPELPRYLHVPCSAALRRSAITALTDRPKSLVINLAPADGIRHCKRHVWWRPVVTSFGMLRKAVDVLRHKRFWLALYPLQRSGSGTMMDATCWVTIPDNLVIRAVHCGLHHFLLPSLAPTGNASASVFSMPAASVLPPQRSTAFGLPRCR